MSSRTPTTGQPGLAATVGLYTGARVALVAVVAALLLLAGVPMLIALLVALIVALPLSMVLFRGLRSRLDGALHVARERRAQEREALRARLRGDVPAGAEHADTEHPDTEHPDASDGAASDEPADREADRGQH
ncbi:DUF4229 domain-containing protein [Pseudonocardia sp. MH-G8]|uniref:DUF4229 domain-containing protein n=1 Tax=Pseudonocardia sp. MH-G8 TaxID=1854588 RepID=UPI000BA06294|nr:DUF4229 domain-containing protein [Pseudonocardia sp. MH-G8]OZM80399.1 hypothetical protein CFP66_19755 [Pseudonocardia sp. MH-G8]